jgi:DNA-binding transcriptional LysR family regulator
MLHETDLSRSDLNLFVLFEAVMRERHVGRAADALNLSPSAVSHGLSRLRVLLYDPLFLRTPRGVVPTDRALELAGPIDEMLASARRIVASAETFDPGTSSRSFAIGAPDGSTSFLLPLMEQLRRTAPGIDVRVRQLLPLEGARAVGPAWATAYTDIDTRLLDVAIGPFEDIPARFEARELWTEDFVVVSRSDHPFRSTPNIDAYCTASHVVVSQTGDAHGFVDWALAEQGLSRRVALTVPGFFMALAVVGATDFLAALPRSFARNHGGSLAVSELPLAVPKFALKALVSKAALQDAGVAWLLTELSRSSSRRL